MQTNVKCLTASWALQQSLSYSKAKLLVINAMHSYRDKHMRARQHLIVQPITHSNAQLQPDSSTHMYRLSFICHDTSYIQHFDAKIAAAGRYSSEWVLNWTKPTPAIACNIRALADPLTAEQLSTNFSHSQGLGTATTPAMNKQKQAGPHSTQALDTVAAP